MIYLPYRSTENLLHRLFVCIAGVADQLQTNFASDLRQILRSVFLINMSSAQEEVIDIPEKTKESELFEFRASENDVIQESAGSNQSIYSAEEVNPELDNVFNAGTATARHSAGAQMQRNNTIDLANVNDHSSNGSSSSSSSGSSNGTTTTNVARNHVARSRSLGDQDGAATSSAHQEQQRQQQMQQQMQRQRNNSYGSNSPSSESSTSSSSEHNSPVSTRNGTRRRLQSNEQPTSTQTTTTTGTGAGAASATMSPPAWIPDGKAPRCMSCKTAFTAFRRRHHCRNCGGVFCGVCSNASAPLPKYGLTKAVRVCRECYVREVRQSQAVHVTATSPAAAHSQTNRPQAASAS